MTPSDAELKRFLSKFAAQRCEDASEPVCRCRCGGALHGAKRGSGLTFLTNLPEDDPHFVPDKEWKAAKKKAEREANWKRRLEILSGGDQSKAVAKPQT